MKHTKPPVNSQQSTSPSVFRIIGGHWRSRKFHFPPTPSLRPTPDRVRETLFNWLQDDVSGAVCLDLFCGSGALGLEALSRGAKHCTFIDAEQRALAAISNHLEILQCTQATLLTSALPSSLSQLSQAVDIVFLDPPYSLDCMNSCLKELVSRRLLNHGALVYIELSAKNPLPLLPVDLQVHRHKIAGQVQYALLQFNATASLCGEDPL